MLPDLVDVRRVLAGTPAALRSFVDALPDAALRYRESPGTWNVLEVLRHLADGEIVDWIPRVKTILSDSPDRRFTPFDREGGFKRYGDWDAAALLDEFTRLRGTSLAAFDALHISERDLGRTGEHPEFGSVTLGQLIATWATHDIGHLAQISRIVTRYFGRGVGPWAAYFSLLRNRENAGNQ